MQAGRELDALVAEKVMQWPVTEEWPHTLNLVPRYSTSIDAAWEVVKKLKPRNNSNDEQNRFFNFCEHLAELCEVNTWNEPVQCAIDDFMKHISPELICLAALKAVGCELPQETHHV